MFVEGYLVMCGRHIIYVHDRGYLAFYPRCVRRLYNDSGLEYQVIFKKKRSVY